MISAGFYPRHPRGWRLPAILSALTAALFLSTPPSRVATKTCMLAYQSPTVSIHATLAGGDSHRTAAAWAKSSFLSPPPSRVATGRCCRPAFWAGCFYPRHPRGWRRKEVAVTDLDSLFLSTPPSRVATDVKTVTGNPALVSIHATLAGGDHCALIGVLLSNDVSIHATLAGGD